MVLFVKKYSSANSPFLWTTAIYVPSRPNISKRVSPVWKSSFATDAVYVRAMRGSFLFSWIHLYGYGISKCHWIISHAKWSHLHNWRSFWRTSTEWHVSVLVYMFMLMLHFRLWDEDLFALGCGRCNKVVPKLQAFWYNRPSGVPDKLIVSSPEES